MLERRYPQGALSAEEGLERFLGGGVGRQVILELCLEDDSSPEWGRGFRMRDWGEQRCEIGRCVRK